MARATITIPKVDKAIIRQALQKAIKAAAQRAVAIVAERTAKSQDIDGAPFKPYSPAYALLRQQAGRGTTPDLTLTGQLLRALRVLRVEPMRAIVGVEGQHRANRFSAPKGRKQKRTVRKTTSTVPNALVLLGNHLRRPFFGIRREQEISVLIDVANRVIAAEVRKATKK